MHSRSLISTIATVAALACLCSCAETKNNFSISGTLPSSGTINTPYSGTLTAKGGNGGDTWMVTGLPDGVTAPVTSGATLAVSGTPTTPGIFSVSATVTDVNGDTKTYTASINITGEPLQISPASFGNFSSGQTISGTTFTASPATQGPYTWTVTSGALPAGLYFSDPSASSTSQRANASRNRTIQTGGPSVTVSGTPSNSGAYFFTLSVADSFTPVADSGSQPFSGITYATATACAGAPLARGNESALTRPYAFLIQGQDDNLLPIAYAGSFTPDGNGGVTIASVDFEGAAAGPQSLNVNLAYSSYSFDGSGRGCLYLDFENAVAEPKRVSHHVLPDLAAQSSIRAQGPSLAGRTAARLRSGIHSEAASFGTTPAPVAVTLSFTLDSQLQSGGMIEFDDLDGTGSLAAGQIHQQDPSAFSLASLAPNFSYGLTGWYTLDEQTLDRASLAGNFSQSAGAVSSGVSDANIAGNYLAEATGGTGTFGPVSSSSGRGESTYSVDVSGTTLNFQYAYYVIDASDYFVISTDSAANVGSFLVSGRAIAASTSASPLNGSYMAEWSGLDLSANEGAGGNFATIGILNAGADGTVSSFSLQSNDAGTISENDYSGAYVLDAESSRVTFSGFDGPVAYLTAPNGDNSIAGFLVGTDAFTSSGLIAFQGNPPPAYSPASLEGVYVMSSLEDITGQSATVTSLFSFDGNANYEGIADVDTNDYLLADQPLSGSYAIDGSGFGEIGGGFYCVTNGTVIFGMDLSGGPDPLVYIFNAPPQAH